MYLAYIACVYYMYLFICPNVRADVVMAFSVKILFFFYHYIDFAFVLRTHYFCAFIYMCVIMFNNLLTFVIFMSLLICLQFLNQHGGSSNAFTSNEHTNYFFDVAPEHLGGALDRLVTFFYVLYLHSMLCI